MDTLLQFEETLADQEVIQRINTLIQDALDVGTSAGWEQAEHRLEELLHRYPNCTTLHYNAAATYDAFQMFYPSADQDRKKRWQNRKRTLLEQVRAAEKGAYWQSATIGLASAAISQGELEQGAALLRELPEQIGDPANVWALYYLKKEEPEQALKLIQKQLYKLVSRTQTCLTTLMNPALLPEPEKQQKVCEAYRAIARTFGLMDMSDGWMLEHFLHLDKLDKAADCFASYVDTITGPAVLPDKELFTPGLTYSQKEGQQATTKELRRLLLQEITQEQKYQPLFDHPVFAAALEKLNASV